MTIENDPKQNSWMTEQIRHNDAITSWINNEVSYEEFKNLYLNQPNPISFNEVFIAILNFLKLKV